MDLKTYTFQGTGMVGMTHQMSLSLTMSRVLASFPKNLFCLVGQEAQRPSCCSQSIPCNARRVSAGLGGYARSLEDQKSLSKCAEGECGLTVHGHIMKNNFREKSGSQI